MMIMPPMEAPTPIPAFAPVVRPACGVEVIGGWLVVVG